MTRKEIVKLIKEQETEGNEQVMILAKLINLYLPRFLTYPEEASIIEIKQYNSLVRNNIYEKALQDKLIIRK